MEGPNKIRRRYVQIVMFLYIWICIRGIDSVDSVDLDCRRVFSSIIVSPEIRFRGGPAG
jgi:hypothetical protein